MNGATLTHVMNHKSPKFSAPLWRTASEAAKNTPANTCVVKRAKYQFLILHMTLHIDSLSFA